MPLHFECFLLTRASCDPNQPSCHRNFTGKCNRSEVVEMQFDTRTGAVAAARANPYSQCQYTMCR